MDAFQIHSNPFEVIPTNNELFEDEIILISNTYLALITAVLIDNALSYFPIFYLRRVIYRVLCAALFSIINNSLSISYNVIKSYNSTFYFLITVRA